MDYQEGQPAADSVKFTGHQGIVASLVLKHGIHFPQCNRYSRNAYWDFPGGPVVKNPPCNAGDTGSIPGRENKIPCVAEQLSLCATTKTQGSQIKEALQILRRINKNTHQTPGDSEGPGSLACWSPWDHKESNTI